VVWSWGGGHKRVEKRNLCRPPGRERWVQKVGKGKKNKLNLTGGFLVRGGGMPPWSCSETTEVKTTELCVFFPIVQKRGKGKERNATEGARSGRLIGREGGGRGERGGEKERRISLKDP